MLFNLLVVDIIKSIVSRNSRWMPIMKSKCGGLGKKHVSFQLWQFGVSMLHVPCVNSDFGATFIDQFRYIWNRNKTMTSQVIAGKVAAATNNPERSLFVLASVLGARKKTCIFENMLIIM